MRAVVLVLLAALSLALLGSQSAFLGRSLRWRAARLPVVFRQTTPATPALAAGTTTSPPTPSVNATPTPTPTRSPTATATATPSATSGSATATATSSSPSATASANRTATASPSPSATIPSFAASSNASITATPTPTSTPTATPTPTPPPSPAASTTVVPVPVPSFSPPANNTAVLDVLADASGVSSSLFNDATFRKAFIGNLTQSLQGECARCSYPSQINTTSLVARPGQFEDAHSKSTHSQGSPTTSTIVVAERWLPAAVADGDDDDPLQWHLAANLDELLPGLWAAVRAPADSNTTAVAIQVSTAPSDVGHVSNLINGSLFLSSVLETAASAPRAEMKVVSITEHTGTITATPTPIAMPSASSSSVPSGAIAGIVVGFVAAATVAAVGIFFWRRYRRRKAEQDALLTKAAAAAATQKYREQQAAKAAEEAAKRLLSGAGGPMPAVPSVAADPLYNGMSAGRHAGLVTLRELARARILQGMMRIVKIAEEHAREVLTTGTAVGWASGGGGGTVTKKLAVVVVADRRALAILSAACRLTDLIQEGALVVESLEGEREAMTRLSAVYFVTPSARSLERLVADFPRPDAATPRRGTDPAIGGRAVMPPATIKYRAAHVFTTARVPDEMLKQLRDAPVLVQRLLTFTELNLDLMAIEQRVFSLDHGRALEVLFGPAEGAAGLSAPHRMALALEKQEMVQEIARNLLTLCHLIGEVPRIRYQRSACGVAESVAQALHEAIEEYEASVPGGMRGAQQTAQELTVTAADADSPTSERAAERSHTVLIILDRSIDPVAPLLHEFTYQAMCNDLLAVDTVDTGGARYAYTVRGKDAEAPVPQEALLDEYADAAWPELRHLHLMDVIGRINAAIRGSVATPRSGLSRDEDVLSASGAPSLWPALTESPRFLSPMQQQRIGKYAVHMDLVDCCMRLFRERHLQRTALCEQDLACGLIDCQGKSMEAAEAAQRTALILRDEHVPIEDKIRLLAVVVATMDVSARDVDDLLDAMGDVGSGKEVISGLLRSMLGVHLRKDVAEVQALAARALRHFQGGGGNGAPHTHDLSRFVPLVRDVAEAAARGRLSTRAFPTVTGQREDEAADGAAPPERTRSRSCSRDREGSARLPSTASQRVCSVRRRRSSSAVRRRSRSSEDLERGGGVRDAPYLSEDEGAGDAAKKVDTADTSSPRQRIILFVVGGACASETRAAYEISEACSANVYLGATHILTPARMVESLRALGRHDAVNTRRFHGTELDAPAGSGADAGGGSARGRNPLERGTVTTPRRTPRNGNGFDDTHGTGGNGRRRRSSSLSRFFYRR
ncbi:hypothetical protein CDCA_CDCA12G3433 [Cyanidium caldarium]|uniref:Uncharacterized protein n=1 Tax=Cyanidium caldarium TaxID=2771 RepID=A0AAV9J068_CYACA|nr:hypothetical protein CDCA_CDCA12G3433 [Cyanidium caldarium]